MHYGVKIEITPDTSLSPAIATHVEVTLNGILSDVAQWSETEAIQVGKSRVAEYLARCEDQQFHMAHRFATYQSVATVDQFDK